MMSDPEKPGMYPDYKIAAATLGLFFGCFLVLCGAVAAVIASNGIPGVACLIFGFLLAGGCWEYIESKDW